MLYHLKNLSSSTIHNSPQPWESTCKRPDFENKAAFRAWCTNPSTQGYFYTCFEGVNQSARISKDNPAYRQTGLVVDYDCRMERAAALESVKQNAPPEFKPAWISTTFSGGLRLVYEFEAPIFTYSAPALKSFLTRLRTQFKLARLAPGLDDIVLKSDQTYELGTAWERISETKIPKKVLELWIYEAGTKAKWVSEGPDIPIELVAAEVEKQFPGRWIGDFAEGARGPRFWDAGADNETASIVRSAGMQCFTGPDPFVPWSHILGAGFTTGFQADRVATATSQIYFDNRHYWRRDDQGNWFPGALETLQLHLRVRAGLSREPGRDTCSEVDKAVYHIQCNNRVVAALPFVHRTPGLHKAADGWYLNTSNIKVCAPVEEAQEWGANFPWLAGFFDGFFTTPDQLPIFLAWLRHFYKTAYEGEMARGQAIFIAGPPNRGKTFLGTRILGSMMGGFTDVTHYMLGENAWNSSLFNNAVWNVDDTGPGKDARTHITYSTNIKKHVANENFDYQKKFADAARVHWTGRLAVTLNDDEDSLNMLPEMGISIREKVIFFRVGDRPYSFKNNPLDKELPFFCRWLLDWTPPAEVLHQDLEGERYEVISYQEPSLLEAALDRGRAHEFKELLSVFLLHYFRDKPEKVTWQGHISDLYTGMMAMDPIKELVRRMSPTALGLAIKKLTSQEPGFITRRKVHNRTVWTILRTLLDGEADEPVETD